MNNLFYFGQNVVSVSKEVILSFSVDIKSSDTDIKLPLDYNLKYNCVIEWGDGEESRLRDYNEPDNKSHIYSEVGEYKIEIRGLFEGMNVRNSNIHYYVSGNVGGTGEGIKKLNFADTAIIGIDGDFLSKATLLEDVGYLFYRCKNITEIPIGFLENSLLLTVVNYMFREMELTEIPDGFLSNNINIESVIGIFYNCKRLNVIPVGFLEKNVSITNSNFLFFGCNSLTEIPEGFLDKNIKLSGMYGVFYNCGISVIPDGFLEKNVSIVSISNMFSGCDISVIPDGFLDKNIDLSNVSNLFYNCDISVIPAGFLDKNIKLYNISSMFNGCNILDIPDGFLDKNINLRYVSYLFYKCSGLTDYDVNFLSNCPNLDDITLMFGKTKMTEVKVGLFDNNLLLKNASGVFYGCLGVIEFPESYLDKNIELSVLSSGFSGTGITTIPENILSNNTKLLNVGGLFLRCNELVSVPVGLLSSNINVTNIGNFFYGCNKLTTIPSGLFENNQELVVCNWVFSSNYGIQTIPNDFLVSHIKITNPSWMFYNASSLESIPSNFLSGSKLTITNFGYFAEGTYKLDGVVPEYWDKVEYPNVINSTRAFRDSPLIDNIEDIPDDWK